MDLILVIKIITEYKLYLSILFRTNLDTLKETNNLGEPLIRIDETEAQWIKSLVENDYVDKRFNIEFFTSNRNKNLFLHDAYPNCVLSL